jgi:taurine dioxygenase
LRGKPLSDALGVELVDFDITRPCSPEEQAELRRLFKEHHLLLVRGQNPTIEDHNRFVGYFGPLSAMMANGDAGYVSNTVDPDPTGTRNGPIAVTGTEALIWHADGTYGAHPGIGTSLLAKDVSPEATPTLFANAVRALERLPPALRRRIEALRAVHCRDARRKATSSRFRDRGIPEETWPERGIRSYEHPVIYQGPHLDKEILYVNEFMTSHISNMDRKESDALLDELHGYITADDNVYAHHWQTNDVIIWDNIALQHCRPADMGTARRHLRRLSLDGWNAPEGVIEWYATSTPRDLATIGAGYE